MEFPEISEDDEGIPAELEQMVAEEAARLAFFALNAKWEMDAQIVQCDGCRTVHMDCAWWWGCGFIFVEPSSGMFIISYDRDPATTELMKWECEELDEAVFLIELLLKQSAPVRMPDDWNSQEEA